jgi:tetratricopeptide (TPR) repeat protein
LNQLLSLNGLSGNMSDEVLQIKVAFYSIMGRNDISDRLIRSQIEQDPSNSNLWMRLAQLRFRQGMIDKAKEGFHQAIVLNPNNLEARLCLVVAFCDTGQYSEAQGIYEQVQRRSAFDSLKVRIAENISAEAHRLALLEDQHPNFMEQYIDLIDKLGTHESHILLKTRTLIRKGLFPEALKLLRTADTQNQKLKKEKTLLEEISKAAQNQSEG